MIIKALYKPTYPETFIMVSECTNHQDLKDSGFLYFKRMTEKEVEEEYNKALLSFQQKTEKQEREILKKLKAKYE